MESAAGWHKWAELAAQREALAFAHKAEPRAQHSLASLDTGYSKPHYLVQALKGHAHVRPKRHFQPLHFEHSRRALLFPLAAP